MDFQTNQLPPSFSQPQSSLNQIPSQPKKSFVRIIVGAIIVFVIVAGSLSAYLLRDKIFPSAEPYEVSQISQEIFEGFNKVDSASYTISISARSEPRDTDAKPFKSVISEEEINAVLYKYKRDQDRFRDVALILQALSKYTKQNGTYPKNLFDAGITIPSANDYNYTLSDSGKGFNLNVFFETSDALQTVSKHRGEKVAVDSDKKIATFSQLSPVAYYFSGRPPKEPVFARIISLRSDDLALVPADAKLDLSALGETSQSGERINSRFHLAGNASFGDITMALDADFRKVVDNYYIQVNKMPSLFFFDDLSKIKNKWVKFTPADLPQYGSNYFGSEPATAQSVFDKIKKRSVDQLKTFLKVADKNQALISSEPVKEKLDGQAVYRYDLRFNKGNIVAFYKDLTTEFAKVYTKKRENPIRFDQATLEYLQGKSFNEVFDYLDRNTNLSLWANMEGIPVKIEYKLRVVPDDTVKNFAGRQGRISASIVLTNINQQVTIAVPEESITAADAAMLLRGISREQYLLKQQESIIERSVRRFLYEYKNLVGFYPKSLEDLTVPRGESAKLNEKAFEGWSPSLIAAWGAIEDTGFIKEVPQDIFTGRPFEYSSTGDDYTLKYTIVLPPYQKGSNLFSYYLFEQYSGKISVPANWNTIRKILPRFLEGINTADSKYLSIEAAQAKKDTDGDRVADVLEDIIQTNKNSKDTDKDGFSDYDEITSGSDPLGPGKIESAIPGTIPIF